MKDCRRDPYVACIWRKPCAIPMKPPAMPGREPSKNAVPPKNRCLGRLRKCSQVDRAGSLRLAGLDIAGHHWTSAEMLIDLDLQVLSTTRWTVHLLTGSQG